MRACYGYRLLRSGAALLVLCYGLGVLADGNTVTEPRAAGSSIILPLGHPNESGLGAQWKYKEKTFAIFFNGQLRITDPQQFSGRLKLDNDTLSVEVTDLQIQDSGSYSIVADKSGAQLPTKIIILTVYGSLKIKIESNQTWVESTGSCKVHLVCRAPEDQSVSYTWSGYKTESGAELDFTLSPADGDVTLNCTAVGRLGTGTNTTRVKCNPNKTPPDGGFKDLYIWIAVGGGAAALVLLVAIIAVSCWWKSHKDSVLDSGNTIYADVNNDNAVSKAKRSESINVGSIYETVDDLRVTDKPQTLYDKVTFARPPPPASSSSTSPYQVVL